MATKTVGKTGARVSVREGNPSGAFGRLKPEPERVFDFAATNRDLALRNPPRTIKTSAPEYDLLSQGV
jgi:hypothetical protein